MLPSNVGTRNQSRLPISNSKATHEIFCAWQINCCMPAFNWGGNVYPNLPSDHPKIPAPSFPSRPTCWSRRATPLQHDELDDALRIAWCGGLEKATTRRT